MSLPPKKDNAKFCQMSGLLNCGSGQNVSTGMYNS